MRHRILLVALSAPIALSLPFALTAQTSSDTDRDRSRIVTFLEEKLSTDGQTIRIDGFKGVLSSEASMQSLQISDEVGVWFTLNGVTLDWQRTSLLKGDLIVNELSAQSVTLARLPEFTSEPTSAETTAFALPDLPVSIDLGALTIETLTLGEDVLGLGEDIRLSVEGAANLADGAGAARLGVTRLGTTAGAFNLQADFDNTSTELNLDLSLTEAKGGLISTLLGLPGSPDLALSVQGAGPLDGFTSDIALETLGQPRLTGQVALKALPVAEGVDPDTPRARRFSADLSGDITPLLDPEYASFFGTSTELNIAGTSTPSGVLELEALSLDTQALSLSGTATIGADNLPTAFDLTGLIEDKSGSATLLPLTGDATRINSAAFSAQYDERRGETWHALALVNGLDQAAATIETLALNAQGRISKRRDASASDMIRAVRGAVTLTADGLVMTDDALQSAIGASPSADLTLSWRDGLPLSVERFALMADNTQLQASGSLKGFEEGFEFIGQLGLTASSLERFAPLTGLDLSGAATLEASGSVIPLTGAFDLELAGTADRPRIGIEKVDALLGAKATIALTAKRNETGLTLEQAALSTNSLTATAGGTLASDASDIRLVARLDDIARLDTGISGPLSFDGTLTRAGADSRWRIASELIGPEGAAAQMSGSFTQAVDTADLSIRGTIPLGLANTLTTATLLQGNVLLDLGLNGAPELGSLRGTLQTTAGSEALIPAAGLSFAIERGVITLDGTSATLNVDARSETGGTIATTGALTLNGNFPVNIASQIDGLKLMDPNLYSTEIDGRLTISGPALTRPQVIGTINVGETNVSVNPVSVGAGGDILEITHLAEPRAVRETRSRAGVLAANEDSGTALSVGLNILVNAPNQIYIRGRGLDAELGGTIQLTGTSDNIIPVGEFNLVRGRVSILGKRIEMEEGELILQGNFDPLFSLTAVTSTDDIDIEVVTSGSLTDPEITFSSSPEFPEDEILAQLLFSKSITDISILQAAQLAAAINTLTGGGGSLTSTVRDKLGVDDIDLTTSEDGDAALKVGKYLSDQIYTDVTIDSTGKSEINLNLDATDSITFKGSVSTDGDTGLGVFFEKDY